MMPPLLKGRTFRMFWLGQSISLMGDQIALFAVPITAVLVLHADARQMGLLTAAGLLPSLLFSLHAGSLVDRWGRRRTVMLVSDIARAAAMASIPVAYALGVLHLPQLYAVAFIVGIFDVFFSVSDATMFVCVVDEQHYVEGQALLNGSRAVTSVTGQGTAGVLVALITAPGALIIDAMSFLASAITLWRIRPDEPPPAPVERGHLAAGIQFIRRSPVVRAALGATATVNLFTFAFSAIFILYATKTLGISPAVLGLTLGAGGLGAILGSLVTTRITRRIGTGRTFAFGCVLFPAPLAFVPLATGPHWVLISCLFLAEFGSGLGVMMLDIGVGALFAAEIPHELRSRVSGAYRTVNYGIRPLGALLGGALGASIGLRPTLWISVVGASACALWLLGSPILTRPAQANAAHREPVGAD